MEMIRRSSGQQEERERFARVKGCKTRPGFEVCLTKFQALVDLPWSVVIYFRITITNTVVL